MTRQQMRERRFSWFDRRREFPSLGTTARVYGVSTQTVRRWKTAVAEKGPEALELRHAPGRPSRLTEGQRAELTDILLCKLPLDFSISGGTWGEEAIRTLLRRRYDGVEFNPAHIGRLVRRLTGLSLIELRVHTRKLMGDRGLLEAAHNKV